jgi:transposase
LNKGGEQALLQLQFLSEQVIFVVATQKGPDMAGKLITMSKVKQILQLNEQGVSQREISRCLQIDRKTVGHYLSKNKGLNLAQEALQSMPEEELESLFKAGVPYFESNEEYKYLESQFPYFRKELKRTGVTRFVLWEEYRRTRTKGYSYSQMCHHYQQWLNSENVSMHQHHDYGQEMYIDFTGDKLSYYCPDAGRALKAEVLVTILGGSRYFYVEAVRSQKVEDFTMAVSNSLHHFGGVPKVFIPDNLKSGVSSADKYQPVINNTFLSMANHYGATVSPARSRKPQDKALVESIINVVYTSVFAPLRDQLPIGLTELNKTIQELMAIAVAKNLQNRDYSRKDLFWKYEKSALKPLPPQRYEITKSYKFKVNTEYHVYFYKDRHSYSVPYKYAGKKVKAVVSSSTISFYYNNQQIASHIRSAIENGYTTKDEHRHPNHRYVDQWEPSFACTWGRMIDPVVEDYMRKMMSQSTYPHMARRMHEGVVNLSKKYGYYRLINACKRALAYRVYDYTTLKNILSNNLDDHGSGSTTNVVKLPLHENIRGAQYYK